MEEFVEEEDPRAKAHGEKSDEHREEERDLFTAFVDSPQQPGVIIKTAMGVG
jgi:hypothetical protein